MGDLQEEMFFRYWGFSFSRYLIQAGQQEVNMGKGPPFSSPLQKLGGLLHDGEVRAQVGVVDRVRAHDLQGGDQLVEGILAALHAEGLAHGHPDGGGDLEDHPALGGP